MVRFKIGIIERTRSFTGDLTKLLEKVIGNGGKLRLSQEYLSQDISKCIGVTGTRCREIEELRVAKVIGPPCGGH